MQILEHQFLSLTNLITYTTKADKKKIPEMTEYLSRGVRHLDRKLADKLILTDANNGSYEFLIPVDKSIDSSSEYGFRESFHKPNAVSIRHEGSFSNIKETRKKLINHIMNKNYIMSPVTYYRFVRISKTNLSDCIIDIYICIKQDHF